MKLRQKLFVAFLWLSVINLSIWIGGTLFNMIVVVPLWSKPLPGSVTDFFHGTNAYKCLLDFYGPPWMAFRILPIVIALFLGWHSKNHRSYLLFTLATIFIGLVLSIKVIFPINEVMMAGGGAGISSTEISRMVHTWIVADRWRFVILFVGYLSLLWAFRLPIK